MTDPIRLLEQYGSHLDEAVSPITIDEVRAGDIPQAGTRLARATPGWMAATVAAVALVALVGGTAVLFGGSEPAPPASEPIEHATTVATPSPGTVSVSVSGVEGPVGGDLAGVVYPDGDVSDLADAIGGFWTVITDSGFSTTEVIREPGIEGAGRYPWVSSDALTLEPGTYTLVLWADTSLGAFDRWIPVNTDGRGLVGCRHVFEITDGDVDITLTPTLVPNGWTTDCTTGAVTPGIDPDAAVDPTTNGPATNGWDPWGSEADPSPSD